MNGLRHDIMKINKRQLNWFCKVQTLIDRRREIGEVSDVINDRHKIQCGDTSFIYLVLTYS